MADAFRQMLSELKEGLQRLYPARLQGVYLFGSRARGDAEEDSDVDVLIVLDRVEHYAGEIDRTTDLISGLSRKYDYSLSRVFAGADAFRRADRPFLQAVRADAVPL